MNVAGLDLNLLKAFAALYAERSVTRAARRVGLAQPSMSNALSRLRSVFDDPLFLKTPQGMVPTHRADNLAPRIDAALGLISDALSEKSEFDPTTAKASMVIATPDNMLLSLGPALSARFQSIAPGFDFRFVGLSKHTAFDEIDRGRVDAAIGHFPDLPARFYRSRTQDDRFVVIARQGHPLSKELSTLDGFCSPGHVLVTFKDDKVGRMDVELKKFGRERRVVMVLEQFSVVPHIVAQTDYISSVPISVAEPLAAMAGCQIYELPFSLPTWHLKLIWGQQAHMDPAKKFAISEICSLAS